MLCVMKQISWITVAVQPPGRTLGCDTNVNPPTHVWFSPQPDAGMVLNSNAGSCTTPVTFLILPLLYDKSINKNKTHRERCTQAGIPPVYMNPYNKPYY